MTLKILTGPLINFNGTFLVDTLVVGSLLIAERRTFAVRVDLLQTRRYPVIAHGQHAAEIYAYCLDGYKQGRTKLEAYSPCHLVTNREDGNLIPIVSRITWYLSPEMKTRCEATVRSILDGDIPGDERFPMFDGKPFAKLNEY